MIELKNIHKSFGSLEVLKGIDLHIDKGEVVSIVGPSGAGKTTLLQIMGTLDRPDSGQVIVDGIDVSSMNGKKISEFRNTHVGFVFQFHQLLPEFTALENIMIPAFIAGCSKSEAKQRAMELLEFMNLSDRAQHKPNELSGKPVSVKITRFAPAVQLGNAGDKPRFASLSADQSMQTITMEEALMLFESPRSSVPKVRAHGALFPCFA